MSFSWYFPELEAGEGNGNQFQYSCLENSMYRGTWWATVHGVGKESDMTEQICTCACTHVLTPMCVCMHTPPHTHTIDAHSLLRAANLRAHREILVAQWLEESLGGIFLSLQLSTNTDRLRPYWEIVLVRISRFHEYIKISEGLAHHSACVAAWEIPSKAILQMWFIIMHYMSEILWHFNIHFNYVV